eukprot:31504-Pelagococcus_subviridis.AAC.3
MRRGAAVVGIRSGRPRLALRERVHAGRAHGDQVFAAEEVHEHDDDARRAVRVVDDVRLELGGYGLAGV